MRKAIATQTFNCAKVLFFVFTFVMTQSCAHKEIDGTLVSATPKYQSEFDFSRPDIVKHQLKIVGSLKNRESQLKLVSILIAFQRLTKELNMGKLTLSPLSKTRIEAITFCASSQKAIPEKNEIFLWIKGLPKTQLIKEVLDLYRRRPNLNRASVQDIVWNLENGTLYENFPDNLKIILKQASPLAPVLLPSTLKSEATEVLMPQDIKNASSLIQGKYHSYKEFQDFTEQKKSNLPLDQNRIFSNLPNTDIFASTTSMGYESQTISLYNPTSTLQNVMIYDYHLKALREDVQTIILASAIPYTEEIQKLLEQAALEMIGYIGSQYPTLNKDEKHLVKDRPIEAAIVFYDAIIAESKSEEFYPNSKRNGESDAFRHYVWSALLVRDVGEDSARIFSDAHEMTIGQPVAEKSMDLFNNTKGIEAAKNLLQKEYFNNSTFFEYAKKELESGNLKVLSK